MYDFGGEPLSFYFMVNRTWCFIGNFDSNSPCLPPRLLFYFDIEELCSWGDAYAVFMLTYFVYCFGYYHMMVKLLSHVYATFKTFLPRFVGL